MTCIYDAVLFDFDGVLVDSEPVHFATWRDMLAPLGVTLDWDRDYRGYIGWSDRQMIRDIAAKSDPPREFDALWAVYPRKAVEFTRRMREHLPMTDEMRRLLTGELGSFPLAVVTSTPRADVAPLLEMAGLAHRFAAIVGAEDVERHKPDPEPYRRAAALLGARCPLVVEDSDSGERSGRAAGFAVLRVSSTASVPAMVRAAIRDAVPGTAASAPPPPSDSRSDSRS